MAYSFKRTVSWPYLRSKLEEIFNVSSGHDHDGVNSKLVSAGSVGDGTITNDKLAADVKVGSLAALTTTAKTSIQAAINEIVSAIANIVTQAANSAGAGNIITSAGANKIHQDSGVALTNIPTMAANGGAGNLIQTAAADKAQSDSGIPVANVPQMAAVGGAGEFLYTAGATRAVEKSGYTANSFATAAQGAKADTALQPSGGTNIYRGQVTLGGANPTQVNFLGLDIAATLLGTADEPFALDNGLTLVVNPDAAGDDTVTFAAAAGTSTGAAAPATDITAETDNKFNIAVDGGVATECALTIAAGLNSGANIAAEMQTRIQALGGAFAAVTVAFAGGVYVITSGTKGTGSAVVITPASSANITEELKIGVAAGGVEVAGTGDAANIAAATAAEVAAATTAAATGWTATAVGTKVRITSDTIGAGSSLAVNAGSTADLLLGITGTDYGEEGNGFPKDMADTNYAVMLMHVKDGAGVTDVLSVGNKATNGFRIYSETAGSTEVVDILVFGTPAA